MYIQTHSSLTHEHLRDPVRFRRVRLKDVRHMPSGSDEFGDIGAGEGVRCGNKTFTLTTKARNLSVCHIGPTPTNCKNLATTGTFSPFASPSRPPPGASSNTTPRAASCAQTIYTFRRRHGPGSLLPVRLRPGVAVAYSGSELVCVRIHFRGARWWYPVCRQIRECKH